MNSPRATALPVLFVLFALSSCAHPLGSRASEASFVRAAEGALSKHTPVEAGTQTDRSEESRSYATRADERGSAGLTAESMTSVFESMAVLCGADADADLDPAEESPPEADAGTMAEGESHDDGVHEDNFEL